MKLFETCKNTFDDLTILGWIKKNISTEYCYEIYRANYQIQ